MAESPLWHARTADQTIADLDTSPSGLSAAEAQRRFEASGPNELPTAEGSSAVQILLEQFKNILIIILLIAVCLSAFLGEVLEAIVIAVIVLFAILLGFVQEYRAERAMEALRRMAAPLATVIRGGREMQIPSREVVPGDIVLLTRLQQLSPQNAVTR